MKIAVKNDRTEDSTLRFEPISVFWCPPAIFDLNWYFSENEAWIPRFPLPFAFVGTKNILAEPDCQSLVKREVSDDE